MMTIIIIIVMMILLLIITQVTQLPLVPWFSPSGFQFLISYLYRQRNYKIDQCEMPPPPSPKELPKGIEFVVGKI